MYIHVSFLGRGVITTTQSPAAFFHGFQTQPFKQKNTKPKQAQRTESEILRESRLRSWYLFVFFAVVSLFYWVCLRSGLQLCLFLILFLFSICLDYDIYSFHLSLQRGYQSIWVFFSDILTCCTWVARDRHLRYYRIRSFRESLKFHRHWADLDHSPSYHSSFSHDFPWFSHDFPHDLMAIGHWCPQEALAAKRKLMLLVRSHPEAQGFWAVTEHGLYCNIIKCNIIIWYDMICYDMIW